MPTSLDIFTDEEQMLREAGMFYSTIAFLYTVPNSYQLVQRFAVDVVGPKVREMDENEKMDPSVIKGLFEQGVCRSGYPFHLSNIHSFRFPSAHGYRD